MKEKQNNRPPLAKEEKSKVEAHLKEVRKQLRHNLWRAYKGWWYWHATLKKYKKQGIDSAAIILMPEIHDRDNYLALRYIDQMIRQHKFRKALILTHNPAVIDSAKLFSQNILDVAHCPREKAKDLMSFYCLYNFDKRFFCASIDEPYGREGSRIIGANGITAEEIFVIGVYNTYPYERLAALEYDGKDERVANLMKQGVIADEEAAANPLKEST